MVSQCPDCRGSGVKVQLRQIGPGMVQQLQSHCSECNGSGEVIPERAKCPKCKGEKVCDVARSNGKSVQSIRTH